MKVSFVQAIPPDQNSSISVKAYVPLIGDNHPQLQGQEPRPVLGHLWDDYEAKYQICKSTAGFVAHTALLTMMTRHGYKEECYFSCTRFKLVLPIFIRLMLHLTFSQVGAIY
jgi:hypothetical protein